jgi:hypothetical protein
MMISELDIMTLRFMNGTTLEAVMLSRHESRMRVALKGLEDIVELNEVNGTWVTEDCEPVQVSFAWQRTVEAPVTEEDCICSPDLAAKLVRMLISPGESEEESTQRTAMAAPAIGAGAARVV